MALVDKFDPSKVCKTERESEKMTQSAFFSGKDLNVSVILAMAWCNAKVSALKLSQWVPHAPKVHGKSCRCTLFWHHIQPCKFP